MLHWKELTSLQQWNDLLESSSSVPFAVFKHSTRCSVSVMAKRKLEQEWSFEEAVLPIYYLDLLNYRDISNTIEAQSNVVHQSPQLIVIKNKSEIYHASHGNIEPDQIKLT